MSTTRKRAASRKQDATVEKDTFLNADGTSYHQPEEQRLYKSSVPLNTAHEGEPAYRHVFLRPSKAVVAVYRADANGGVLNDTVEVIPLRRGSNNWWCNYEESSLFFFDHHEKKGKPCELFFSSDVYPRVIFNEVDTPADLPI